MDYSGLLGDLKNRRWEEDDQFVRIRLLTDVPPERKRVRIEAEVARDVLSELGGTLAMKFMILVR